MLAAALTFNCRLDTLDSSWPCCSVIWDVRNRCVRFGATSPPAKASCGTWDCRTRPSAPPWPMPTNTGRGSCTAACFINCSAAHPPESPPLPRSRRNARIPFQEQTVEPGCHPDRTLRQHLRLGAVPAHQRRRPVASAARSSGIAAQLRLGKTGTVSHSPQEGLNLISR